MKKPFLKSFSLILAIILLTAQTHSLSAKTLVTSTPELEESEFYLDQHALDLAFSELDVLDDYLNQNEGVTYADLLAMESDLIANVSGTSAPMGQSSDDNELPLGIPAFWWGCLLGWVGLLLVVVLTDKDKVQTRKAINGCLIGTGVAVVLSGIYYFWLYSEVY